MRNAFAALENHRMKSNRHQKITGDFAEMQLFAIAQYRSTTIK
jgi:hypothetical protein